MAENIDYEKRYKEALAMASKMCSKALESKNKIELIHSLSCIFPELSDRYEQNIIDFIFKRLSEAEDDVKNEEEYQMLEASLKWLDNQQRNKVKNNKFKKNGKD